ncbi:MAG: hypothetical protein IJP66_06400, partial [Kiritimatiellae bacterium]|nr:hypothetical protein [Kiritimatiellia bacterium]
MTSSSGKSATPILAALVALLAASNVYLALQLRDAHCASAATPSRDGQAPNLGRDGQAPNLGRDGQA